MVYRLGLQNVAVAWVIRVTAFINVCSYNKTCGHFAGTRKGACNNKVTRRQGSTLLKF